MEKQEILKAVIIDGILIIASILFCNMYLWYIKKKYGRQRSISHSAKPLQKDGNQVLFYLFITLGVCVSLAYVTRSWMTVISAMVLFGIGIVTGYNPDLKYSTKFQNVMHVVFTNGAITGFATGIMIINPWLSIVVGIAAIPIGYMWIWNKKVEAHTWKIEIVVLWMVWVCLTILRIVMPLVKLYS